MATLTQILLILALFCIAEGLEIIAKSIDKLTKEHFFSRPDKNKEE